MTRVVVVARRRAPTSTDRSSSKPGQAAGEFLGVFGTAHEVCSPRIESITPLRHPHLPLYWQAALAYARFQARREATAAADEEQQQELLTPTQPACAGGLAQSVWHIDMEH